MSKVTKIIHSVATESVQVTLSTGQVACISVRSPTAMGSLINDAKDGTLAGIIEIHAADTPEEIANDYSSASDWATIYGE